MKTPEEIAKAITFEFIGTTDGRMGIVVGVFKLRIGVCSPVDTPQARQAISDVICAQLCDAQPAPVVKPVKKWPPLKIDKQAFLGLKRKATKAEVAAAKAKHKQL